MGKHSKNETAKDTGYIGRHRDKTPPTTKLDDRGAVYGLASRLRRPEDNAKK